MSTLTAGPESRLSVNFKFAYVPAMSLPEPYEPLEPIPRAPPSDDAALTQKTASVTSSQARAKDSETRHKHKIPREEPCFVTGSISYTNEQAHWVNAVRNKSSVEQDGKVKYGKKQIEDHLFKLRVVPREFDLNSPSNLTNLDRSLHKALDLYAFVAVTASDKTLDVLMDPINKDDIERRWASLSRKNVHSEASEMIPPPTFSDLCSRAYAEKIPVKFQLVALHPEHFLPAGGYLTVYRRDIISESVNVKFYGAGSAFATDGVGRRLREIVRNQSLPGFQPVGDPLPDFFAPPRFPNSHRLNPFLVILNAEIKFRRYFRKPAPEENVPAIFRPPLPTDVLNSIQKTRQLVNLLYSNLKTHSDSPLNAGTFSAGGLQDNSDTITPNRLKRSRSSYEEPSAYQDRTWSGMKSELGVDEFGMEVTGNDDTGSTFRAAAPNQTVPEEATPWFQSSQP